jgi:hypothetical protein
MNQALVGLTKHTATINKIFRVVRHILFNSKTNMSETRFLSVIELDDTDSDDTDKEGLEMSSVAQLLFC